MRISTVFGRRTDTSPKPGEKRGAGEIAMDATMSGKTSDERLAQRIQDQHFDRARQSQLGDELLNVELFNDLREAKALIER